MKQRNLVVQEIIDSLSNTSKFNYIGNDQYLIRVPVVGLASTASSSRNAKARSTLTSVNFMPKR